MKAWRVYLRGEHIDTVHFVSNDADEVRMALINHDGLDPAIMVVGPFGIGEPDR